MPDSNDSKAVREFIRLTYQEKRWVAPEGTQHSRATTSTRRNSGSKGRTSNLGEYDDTPQPEPLSNILGDDIPSLTLAGSEAPRSQSHTSTKNDLLLINWDTPVTAQPSVPAANSNPFLSLSTPAHTNNNPFFAQPTTGSNQPTPLFNPFQSPPLTTHPVQPQLLVQPSTPHSFTQPHSNLPSHATTTQPTPLTFPSHSQSNQPFTASQPHTFAATPSTPSFGQFTVLQPTQPLPSAPQPYTQPQPHFTPTPTPQLQPVVTPHNVQMAYQQLTPQQIQMLQQITPQQLQQMTPVQQQQFAILLQQMRQQQQMQISASTPQVSQQQVMLSTSPVRNAY